MKQYKILKANETFILSYRNAVNSVIAEKKYLALSQPFSLEESKQFIQKGIQNQYPYYFVINEDNDVIGWCDITPKEQFNTTIGYLGMGILKQYRHQGIGKELIKTALEGAKKYGFLWIILNVRLSNKEAVSLYESVGFQVTDKKEKGILIDGVMESILQMSLHLSVFPAKLYIKKATPIDAQTISSIHAATWKKAYESIISKQYLDNLKSDFWVCAFENWLTAKTLKSLIIYDCCKAVGCIAYGKARDNSYCNWGEIVSLYILPDYWKKGYGKKLMTTAFNDMKKSNYSCVYLWVLKENKNAIHFYTKLGFLPTEDEYHTKIMGQNLVDIRYTLTF